MPLLTLGLDLGGSTLKVAWIRDGAVLASGTVPNRGEPADLDAVVRLADDLRPDELRPTSCAVDDRIRVGIAVPGVVDRAGTRLVAAHGKYAYLHGVDLAPGRSSGSACGRRWRTTPGPRCSVSSPTGAAVGVRDAVLLVAGTGIGTAAVIDGQLLRGRSGHAGILGGHLTIDRGGEPCNCGNLGCAEVYGGSWSLPAGITMAEVFSAATGSGRAAPAGRTGARRAGPSPR